MTKQLISVGSQANDGTGDTIRSGAQKVNSTLTELYNALGDGSELSVEISGTTNTHVLRSNGTKFINSKLSYNDLSNLPTIPTPQVNVDWNSSSGITQILNKPNLFSGNYADLTNKPSYSTVATTGEYNDLSNKPSISAVGLSGNYNDLLNKPTLFSGSYVDLSNKPAFATVATSGNYNDLTNKPDLESLIGAQNLDGLTDVAVSSPSTGQTIRYNGTTFVNSKLNYSDILNTPSTLSPSRTSIQATSSSLANNASGNIDVVGFKSYLLMKITTNRAAWVTIYTDQTSRTADVSRLETTDPTPGSGVIAEIITTGAQTILLTPGTLGFNNDTTPSSLIYMKVKNISGSTGVVDVTLNILQLEL
jgi:hypothetical protein